MQETVLHQHNLSDYNNSNNPVQIQINLFSTVPARKFHLSRQCPNGVISFPELAVFVPLKKVAGWYQRPVYILRDLEWVPPRKLARAIFSLPPKMWLTYNYFKLNYKSHGPGIQQSTPILSSLPFYADIWYNITRAKHQLCPCCYVVYAKESK